MGQHQSSGTHDIQQWEYNCKVQTSHECICDLSARSAVGQVWLSKLYILTNDSTDDVMGSAIMSNMSTTSTRLCTPYTHVDDQEGREEKQHRSNIHAHPDGPHFHLTQHSNLVHVEPLLCIQLDEPDALQESGPVPLYQPHPQWATNPDKELNLVHGREMRRAIYTSTVTHRHWSVIWRPSCTRGPCIRNAKMRTWTQHEAGWLGF